MHGGVGPPLQDRKSWVLTDIRMHQVEVPVVETGLSESKSDERKPLFYTPKCYYLKV